MISKLSRLLNPVTYYRCYKLIRMMERSQKTDAKFTALKKMLNCRTEDIVIQIEIRKFVNKVWLTSENKTFLLIYHR